ncbi:reductase [Sandaracinobacteroides saxicola]|uniref:Reductase n=1 Tax=Sandaracinobacteroides saxicola TaxID=2759707 RepID=A0A7G5IMA2_9SPHN|nr:reductase [Sandaracinobacteroides saxicola]
MDLLLNTVAFDAADTRPMLDVAGDVGTLMAISSASVYRDAAGRTLDEARVTGFPDFPVPISSQQPTVSAGPATYSTRKIAMEQALADSAHPSIVILRPCAIHGPFSRHPREWWVVKRLRDGRPRIPLAFDGTSRFQPTATSRIAAVVEAAIGRRGVTIANVADADCPDAAGLVGIIARHLGRQVRVVPLAGSPRGAVGYHPWCVPGPKVVADEGVTLGAEAPLSYAATVGPGLDWLMAQTTDWREAFPPLAAYPFDLFDYAAEDGHIDLAMKG